MHHRNKTANCYIAWLKRNSATRTHAHYDLNRKKNTMFVNYTNHPSAMWSNKQLAATRPYGKIIDIPFFPVDPSASAEKIQLLASEAVAQILDYKPDAVLVQGEFTLVYHVAGLLKEYGVLTLTACTERIAKEQKYSDTVRKESYYRFIQYREY